jgi:hypothetical protein
VVDSKDKGIPLGPRTLNIGLIFPSTNKQGSRHKLRLTTTSLERSWKEHLITQITWKKVRR